MREIRNWIPLAVCVALVCAAVPLPASQGTTPSATHTTARKSTAKKSSKKRRPHGPPMPKGPTADRITEIQSALARGGYYQGDSTGKWDSDTIAAVQKFQSANDIDATGKLDAKTLQKLGLGSEIAGVSAPRPIMTPSPDQAAPPASMAPPHSQSSVPSASGAASATTIASATPSVSTGPSR